MEELSKYLQLIADNLTTIFSVVVGIATILNQFMPRTITNEKLAKLEAITSKLSAGNKKAVVIKYPFKRKRRSN